MNYDLSWCFTLDNTICSIRQLSSRIQKYIDERKIVENWIDINKIPKAYIDDIWMIYKVLDKKY